MIKATCPIDHKPGVFAHVSPIVRMHAWTSWDLFLGACGHEVRRRQIELEH